MNGASQRQLNQGYAADKIKKILQACKPDSVVGYHLSVQSITAKTQSAYPLSHCIAANMSGSLLPIVYVAFQHARFTRPGCYQPTP